MRSPPRITADMGVETDDRKSDKTICDTSDNTCICCTCQDLQN